MQRKKVWKMEALFEVLFEVAGELLSELLDLLFSKYEGVWRLLLPEKFCSWLEQQSAKKQNVIKGILYVIATAIVLSMLGVVCYVAADIAFRIWARIR